MPTPKEDETEEEFIARCVPIVMEDETAETNKQAVAICYSMWRQAQEEKEVKRGLYLAEPHGHLTASGKKRAIAKADELELEGKHVLVSKDKAYGIIDLSTAQPVTIEEFDERFDAGEDMAAALDTARARRPGEEPRRVNVNFPRG